MRLKSQGWTKATDTGIDIALIVIDIVIAKYSQQVLISILLFAVLFIRHFPGDCLLRIAGF